MKVGILLPAVLLGVLGSRYLILNVTASRHGPRAAGQIVRLHCVDSAGRPVSGAQVHLWDNGARSAAAAPRVMPRTDSEGNVAVTDPRITHFSAIGDGTYASGEITVPGGEQVVTLLEHPPHTVTGRFVDREGNPLMGAKPELYVVDSQTVQSLMTDPKGRFIAFVVPGNSYRISLAQPGYTVYTRDGIRLAQGQNLNLGTITLPPARP